MYNYKSIENFIEKVNKEAEEAAQKVYDKYNDELLERIQAQIKKDDVVWNSMGTAIINNSKGNEVGENLATVLGQSQYWSDNISAGFSLPYNFTKSKIIKS